MNGTKLIFILGATGAVGAEIVKQALHEGWDVVAFARSYNELSKRSDNVKWINFDAADVRSIDRAFEEANRLGFFPNAAVNCFGVTSRAAFLLQTIEQWDEVMNVNLRGTWRSIQREAGTMKSRGGGSIINIGSVAGLRANSWGESPYIASKHGLIGLTKAAAVELGPMGIRVNVICPSVMRSGFTQESLFDDEGFARFAAKTPTGRLVTKEEVSRIALWLCSSESSAINGAVIPVDGGITAK